MERQCRRIGGKPPADPKPSLEDSAPRFWGRDDIVRRHAIFEGLPSGRLMDLTFYGDVIARQSFTGFGDDVENVSPSFALGRPGGDGYWAGSSLLAYRIGRGRALLSTLRILDNLGRHPAADRLVLNMINWGSK